MDAVLPRIAKRMLSSLTHLSTMIPRTLPQVRHASSSSSSGKPLDCGLHRSLELETVDPDLHIARASTLWLPPGARAVFGGQVVGQALVAATRTAPPGRRVHSVHSYFLAPGRPDKDVVYRVSRTRDGGSFSSRSVVATQDSVPIFQAMVSFTSRDGAGAVLADAQAAMPEDVPPPESLSPLSDLWRRALEDPRMPSALEPVVERALQAPFPLDVRHVDPRGPFDAEPRTEARQLMWIRAQGDVGDDPHLHRCIAAAASDWHLCTTPLLTSPYSFPSPKIKAIASVDHSLWFFDDFRADEWMLYEMESPRSGGGLGVNYGRLYRRDGILAATVAQECLIRLHGEAE